MMRRLIYCHLAEKNYGCIVNSELASNPNPNEKQISWSLKLKCRIHGRHSREIDVTKISIKVGVSRQNFRILVASHGHKAILINAVFIEKVTCETRLLLPLTAK